MKEGALVFTNEGLLIAGAPGHKKKSPANTGLEPA